MNPGLLTHKVAIEYISGTTRSAIGEELPTWSVFACLWARVEPLRGIESINLRMEGAEMTTRIRTRYIQGVKPAMRIKQGADTYQILEVYSPLEKRRELEMLCRKDAD